MGAILGRAVVSQRGSQDGNRERDLAGVGAGPHGAGQAAERQRLLPPAPAAVHGPLRLPAG